MDELAKNIGENATDPTVIGYIILGIFLYPFAYRLLCWFIEPNLNEYEQKIMNENINKEYEQSLIDEQKKKENNYWFASFNLFVFNNPKFIIVISGELLP